MMDGAAFYEVITVFDGLNTPYEIELQRFEKPEITFGRYTANDIVLQSKIVSGNHGQFIRTQGGWMVIDNASTNGLHVNDVRVTSHVLAEGDVIRIDNPESAMKTGVSLAYSHKRTGGVWQRFDLAGVNEVTIGRDASCTIQIDHVAISRIHARLTRASDGNFYITDNKSTNGIFIKGVRITGTRLLQEMDVVFIANFRLVFRKHSLNYVVYDKGIGVDILHVLKTVPSKKGALHIVNDVSLSIRPLEFIAIVGGSGAGKSSLLNCLCGLTGVSKGNILINGDDLHQNYDVIKSLIGYVPQQDIVHGDLTLKRMLAYTAEMRMTRDASSEEIAGRVAAVIRMVELEGKEDTFIRRLSGGQRKRASIALELLADPKLFFLDEPTSGLDPGTEKNLMHTLKKMTQKDKTVILVTHNTLNLHLCDRIIFMGYGGRLCFFGSPKGALAFFGVSDFVDIYQLINSEPEKWESLFRQTSVQSAQSAQSDQGVRNSALQMVNRNKESALRQWLVQSRRYFELVINDRRRLLLLLLQAPLLGLLLCMVSDTAPNTPFVFLKDAKALMFSLTCAAFWVGLLNSIQEICKERSILVREQMANLKASAYIGSKIAIQGGFCLVQSFLLVGVVALLKGLPEHHLVLPPFAEIYLTTFLAAFSATALGLVISAFSPNPDRAMAIAPLLLMPQILFSNVVFELKGFVKYLATLITSKWAMDAYSATVNLDNLLVKNSTQSDASALLANTVTYTSGDLVKSWSILAFSIILCAFISTMAIWQAKQE